VCRRGSLLTASTNPSLGSSVSTLFGETMSLFKMLDSRRDLGHGRTAAIFRMRLLNYFIPHMQRFRKLSLSILDNVACCGALNS